MDLLPFFQWCYDTQVGETIGLLKYGPLKEAIWEARRSLLPR
jgi:hypothetical protein